jgi:hypothetical protein
MLNEIYKSVQNEMLAKLQASRSSISHSAEMGSASEDDWIDWFNTYLPKRYQAKRAFVVDSQNGVSQQIDIVVHDAQYSHLIFKHNNTFYVPAESVYAVFEVKQELTKAHLQYAKEKAESVRKLIRTSAPIPHAGGTYPPKEPHFIPAGILTVTSNWKEPLGTTFLNNLNALQGNQSLQLGCVIQSGAFSVTNSGVEISKADLSLVSFFFDLLIRLQSMGTVTAIDIQAYANALKNQGGQN